MKKKIIFLVLFISVFLLVGCGKKDNKAEEKKLELPVSIGTITFTYPKSQSFILNVEAEEKSEEEAVLTPTIYNADLGIGMQIGAGTITKSEYTELINSSKDFGGFKQFKWDDYKGFVLVENNTALRFVMILENNEKSDEMTILSGFTRFINEPGTNSKQKIYNSFKNKIIKDFLCSAKLEKEE